MLGNTMISGAYQKGHIMASFQTFQVDFRKPLVTTGFTSYLKIFFGGKLLLFL